jgi:hypothetical protein
VLGAVLPGRLRPWMPKGNALLTLRKRSLSTLRPLPLPHVSLHLQCSPVSVEAVHLHPFISLDPDD